MKKRVLICGNGYVGGYVFAQLSKNTSLDVTLESKATLDYTDEYYLHDVLMLMQRSEIKKRAGSIMFKYQ